MCEEFKEDSKFYNIKGNKLSARCKKCSLKKNSEFRKTDKRKKYLKNWVTNNIDKIYTNHKVWRSKNPEIIKENAKDWLKNNKDKLKAYNNTPKNILMNKARDVSQNKVSLIDKECELCGSKEHLHRHHNDYNNPMDINILCCSCHHEWHRNNKPIYPTTPSSIKGLLN